MAMAFRASLRLCLWLPLPSAQDHLLTPRSIRPGPAIVECRRDAAMDRLARSPELHILSRPTPSSVAVAKVP